MPPAENLVALWHGAASAALLYPIPVAVLRAYYEPSKMWPNSPIVMYFWTSIPAIASLVLFGLMTRELRSDVRLEGSLADAL